MKTRFITALLAAASLLAGCSKETTDPGDTDDSRIPITFTLATPGSEGVIYPRSATRATHDAAENFIKTESCCWCTTRPIPPRPSSCASTT